MKLWRSKPGKWLITLVSMILLIWAGTLLSDWIAYMYSPQMWAKNFMAQGPESLNRLAMEQGDRADVNFYPGDTDPETGIFIKYIPEDEFVYQEIVDDPDDWHLVSSSENKWRWEGGMIGKGYLDVKRLQPQWFYVEYFNPT